LEAKVKRSLTICLLSVSLGMPAVIAVSETCRTHSEAYNRFLAKINRPVKRTHTVSKARAREIVAYNKAMLAKLDKQLEVMCGSIDKLGDWNLHTSADGIADDSTGYLLSGYGSGHMAQDLGEDLLDSTEPTALLAAVDYPTYDSPSRSLPEMPGYPGFGGWYGGGGYIGGNPSAPPVTPIQPTPESSTLAFLAIGIAAGIWKVSRA
jgi:hypothetical protein